VAALVGHPQHHAAVRGLRRRLSRGHRSRRPGHLPRYIARGYFSVIALNFTDTPALDHRIAAQLHHDLHYRIAQVVPYGTEVKPYGLGTYIIWRYQRG